jgi:hypothetical protein
MYEWMDEWVHTHTEGERERERQTDGWAKGQTDRKTNG